MPPVLRVAHLTDVHIQPEGPSAAGLELALILAQKEKPDLLLMGGDLVMDSLECDRARLTAQWDLYTEVMSANASTPVITCLGNHDVWGWGNREFTSSEPEFGKRYALGRLGMANPYYSFDRAGWHFIVLDSTYPLEGNGYTARLDEEQFQWLQKDLAATPSDTPIFVLSHIPIFAACAFLLGDNEATGNWRVPGQWMHLDVRRIQALFRQYPNIKVCVAGHMHLRDRVDYLGVTYYCNPAVCANWWNGPLQYFQNSFSILDLYEDGTVTNRAREFELN